MFSRAAGREWPCRQISLACVGSTRRVPATLGLPRSRVCAFPVYTAQAPGCSRGSEPCVACGSSFRVFHKHADSVGPAFCAFPGGISSGGQELDELTLPRCGVPSPLQSQPQFLRTSQVPAACVYSREVASSRDPPGGCRPSRISGSLWLETGDLFAVW